MKSALFCILIGCILLTSSCEKQDSHRLETQVVRTSGTLSVLSVVSKSDVKGTMTIQTNHSQVTFSYGNGNDVMVDPTRISIQGKLWGEIPEATKKVLINFSDSEFTVQIDPQK